MARKSSVMPHFARFRPRLFDFLLKSRKNLEVPISSIIHYRCFVHLTTLLFRTSIFLFGPESPEADRSSFQTCLILIYVIRSESIILTFPVFQLDSLTQMKLHQMKAQFGILVLSADSLFSKFALLRSGESKSFPSIVAFHSFVILLDSFINSCLCDF